MEVVIPAEIHMEVRSHQLVEIPHTQKEHLEILQENNVDLAKYQEMAIAEHVKAWGTYHQASVLIKCCVQPVMVEKSAFTVMVQDGNKNRDTSGYCIK